MAVVSGRDQAGWRRGKDRDGETDVAAVGPGVVAVGLVEDELEDIEAAAEAKAEADTF